MCVLFMEKIIVTKDRPICSVDMLDIRFSMRGLYFTRFQMNIKIVLSIFLPKLPQASNQRISMERER